MADEQDVKPKLNITVQFEGQREFSTSYTFFHLNS